MSSKPTILIRIIVMLCLLALLGSLFSVAFPGTAQAANVILNSEFDSGTANWALGNWGGAASTWTVVTGAGLSGTNAARVTITNPGTAGYNIQLRQAMPITAGKTYTITFKAKASAARTMSVVVQKANAPWTTYYTAPTVNLTTTAQTFGPYTFTATTSDAGTLLEFYLGGNAATIYIDQVIVNDGAATNTPVPPTATPTSTPGGSGNRVINPGFETGTLSPWTSWNSSVVSNNAQSGTYALALTSGSGASTEQTITGLQANTTYTLTGWVKNSAAARVDIGVHSFGGSTVFRSANSATYTQLQMTFTTGASNTSAVIYCYQEHGGTGYCDSFNLTGGSGGGPTPTATRTPTRTPTPLPVTPTPTSGTTTPPQGQVLFDDFNYTGATDPNLSNFGWIVRTGAGGPGCGGWQQSNVTFLNGAGGNRIMQLAASIAGSCDAATQAEIYTASEKFFEGTYAARVYFTDAPVSGPDGDNIIQTFFTYHGPASDIYDMDHRELDYEYLPNGGFGGKIPPSGGMLNTSWETYCYDEVAPMECLGNSDWDEVSEFKTTLGSWAGWHTLVFQVSNGLIRYYLDGTLVATHSDPNNPPAPHPVVGSYDVYPEGMMRIHFNLWFFRPGIIANSTSRTYQQQVDWVYFAKDAVLSPAQVEANAANYRTQGTVRLDTVP